MAVVFNLHSVCQVTDKPVSIHYPWPPVSLQCCSATGQTSTSIQMLGHDMLIASVDSSKQATQYWESIPSCIMRIPCNPRQYLVYTDDYVRSNHRSCRKQYMTQIGCATPNTLGMHCLHCFTAHIVRLSKVFACKILCWKQSPCVHPKLSRTYHSMEHPHIAPL